MKSHCYKMRHRQVAYIFVKQVVFLTVNHRGPLPLRELHSTDETIVWRDPGGSWACLPPVYSSGWNHPATNYDTCRLCPEKQSEKKGAIWNAKKNKTTKLMNWEEEGVTMCKKNSDKQNLVEELSGKNSEKQNNQQHWKTPERGKNRERSEPLQRKSWLEESLPSLPHPPHPFKP